MYDLGIVNGFIVSGKEIKNNNLYISNGKVAKISPDFFSSYKTYDAAGVYILPGCIDVHCHFRDPGHTAKEDFPHGTRAAAVGGVTTVLEMPNTNPPVVDGNSLQAKADYLSNRAYVDYGLWGLALGKLNSNKLQEMANSGAVAFKFLWGYAVNNKTYELIYNYKDGMPDLIPPLNNGEVFELFEDVAQTGLKVAIHAEDHALIHTLTSRVLKSENRDYGALLQARPNLTEEVVIKTAISFAKATGARLHIAHMTTREGVELVREAKKQGISVTAETCTHFLFLDADDYERVGPVMKVYPPVRGKEDQNALWQGLADGTIDIICSDHAPHTVEQKIGDIFSTPAGMCDVETMLPLMLNEVSRGVITLPFVVKKLAENPAKLFDLFPQKGCLEVGADADIVIVDMNRQAEIRNEKLHSKEPLTAYHGTLIKGWPIATFVRGHQVVKAGEIISEPLGKFLRRSKLIGSEKLRQVK